MRFFLAILMAAMFMAPPAHAVDPRADLPTLLVAVPQSGPLAKFGLDATRGAELALKTLGGGFTMRIIDEGAPWPEDLSLDTVPIASGYFTERGLASHAPRYMYLKKTVLLPFLGTKDGAALDAANFFRLLPTDDEQGEYLAMRLLNLKKRPRRILVIQGGGEGERLLGQTFVQTLAEPVQPPEPPAPPAGQKRPKKPAPIKPLDKSAVIVTVSPEDDFFALAEFAKNPPDLIFLAVEPDTALNLAPRLAASKFLKAQIWGGAYLGFRDVGAAFGAWQLNLSVALPIDLADNSNGAVRDFKTAYAREYKIRPTWISALAYDSLNLAIKAVSATVLTGQISTFLNGHSHHALGAYALAPGGAGRPPITMMAVTEDSLAYLP